MTIQRIPNWTYPWNTTTLPTIEAHLKTIYRELVAESRNRLGDFENLPISALNVTDFTITNSIDIDYGTANYPVYLDSNKIIQADQAYVPVTRGGTSRGTSTTAYGLLAAGTTATGAHQTLAAGGTNEILVGGGASALPAWGTNIPTSVTIGSAYIYRAGGTEVPAVDGGTGLGSYAVGDVLYANTTATLSRLAAVATGQVIISQGATTAPVWSASPSLTDITLGGDIISAGALAFKVSGDSSDYISFQTAGDVPEIITTGSADLKIAPDTGNIHIGYDDSMKLSLHDTAGNEEAYLTIAAGTLEINADSTIYLSPSNSAEQTITATETTFGGNIVIPSTGTIGLVGDTDLFTLTANTATVAGTVAATTVTGANVTSGADPGHTHTGTSISSITVADTADATCFLGLWESATGALLPKTDAGLTYDASIGELTIIGDVHLIHTATEMDDHAIKIDSDGAGFGDVKALDINYITGILATGEDEGVFLINIDKTLATGGEIFAFEVLATDQVSGTTGVYGLKTGPGIGPIHQDSGTFANPTLATDNTPTTDVGIMRDGNIATTTAICSLVNEYIIIGAAAAFEDIEFILATASSKSIKPTFWYSTVGTNQFTQFTPVDGTDGFVQTGVVSWDNSDLTGHVADGTTSTFNIKIIRTRATAAIVTPPVLGYAKTAATTEYVWDKDGNVSINSITATTLTGALSGNASTATALETARTIGGTSFDGTANIDIANVIVADTTDTTCWVALFQDQTGTAVAPKTDAGLIYNAGTTLLTSGLLATATTGYVSTGSYYMFDTNQSNTLQVLWNENDASDRVLNLLVSGGDRSLTVEDDTVVSQDYSEDAAPIFSGPFHDVGAHADFETAISDIGATETTLIISTQETVSNDVTVPGTMTLKFTRGGSLSVDTTKTVTVNGDIEAGQFQIFEGAGDVAGGRIGNAQYSLQNDVVYAAWFGVYGNNDNGAKATNLDRINAALTFAYNSGVKRVMLPPGTIYVDDAIVFPGNSITLEGATSVYGHGDATATPTTILKWEGASAGDIPIGIDMGAANANYYCEVKNLKVHGGQYVVDGVKILGFKQVTDTEVTDTTGYGIHLGASSSAVIISRCNIVGNFGGGIKLAGLDITACYVVDTNIRENLGYGVELQEGWGTTFTRCVIESNWLTGVHFNPQVSTDNLCIDTKFNECWFENNDRTAIAAPGANYNVTFDALSANILYWAENTVFNQCYFSGSNVVNGRQVRFTRSNKVTFNDCRFVGYTSYDHDEKFVQAASQGAIRFHNCVVDNEYTGTDAQSSATELTGIVIDNRSTANNTTKSVSMNFQGRDTSDNLKGCGKITAVPAHANWTSGHLTFSPETGDGTMSEVLRLTSGTRMGLMTTAPDKKFEINTGAATDGMRISYNDAGGSAATYADFLVASTGFLTIASSVGGVAINTHSTAGDDFTVNTTSLVVEGDTGNVGMGLAAPSGNLEIYGSANATFHLTANTDNAFMYLNSNSDGGGTEASFIYFRDNGTAKCHIGKDTGNDFVIVDDVRGAVSLEVIDNGDMKLMAGGGNVGIGKSPSSQLDINLGTEDLEIVDAGSTDATEQDWIEVEVGGNQGYIRVYAAK